MLSNEEFLKHLREALNHLYDFAFLRASPLASLLGVAARFDAPVALQSILVEAIESLEPSDDEPSHSRAWRTYELLFYRYVQQLSQQETAEQLGIGARHVRREQQAALEALAYRLWDRLGLEGKRQSGATEARSVPSSGAASAVNRELAWLKDAPIEGPTDLAETLSSVLNLVQPLAEQHDISIRTTLAADLPGLAGHPVALSEALLNLLTVAIHQASAGTVHIMAQLRRYDVEIRICSAPRVSVPGSISGDDAACLDIAGRLADFCRGRLDVSEAARRYQATMTVPSFEQLPVLVLDDNADTLLLLERYTSGSRYRFHGTREPGRLLRIAGDVSPQIIVLDVMMPQVDGWKLLGQLREHPLSEHIPIVVCTILAQEELALSLGASAFLRKPFKRQEYLAALDKVVRAETESRQGR